MTFQKGNKEQKKAKNPGRKPIEEELKIYRESIKKQTLEEIATMRVHNQLVSSENYAVTKELGLPVYLKSKADKVENKNETTVVHEVGKESQDILQEIINKRKKNI